MQLETGRLNAEHRCTGSPGSLPTGPWTAGPSTSGLRRRKRPPRSAHRCWANRRG